MFRPHRNPQLGPCAVVPSAVLPLHRLAPGRPNHHHITSANGGNASSTTAASIDPEGLMGEEEAVEYEDRTTGAAGGPAPLGGRGTLWTLSMAHLPFGSHWLWCVGAEMGSKHVACKLAGQRGQPGLLAYRGPFRSGCRTGLGTPVAGMLMNQCCPQASSAALPYIAAGHVNGWLLLCLPYRLHFVLAFAYVWYGTWLLAWHYRQYAIMRQYYLQKGT